jgi:hypothetical protein
MVAQSSEAPPEIMGKRARDEGMTMGGLGTLLQREIPGIRQVLPPGVTDLLWPHTRETITASTVVAQAMTREEFSAKWLVPLLLLALIPLFWLINRAGRPVAPAPPAITGTANRAVAEPPQFRKQACRRARTCILKRGRRSSCLNLTRS